MTEKTKPTLTDDHVVAGQMECARRQLAMACQRAIGKLRATKYVQGLPALMDDRLNEAATELGGATLSLLGRLPGGPPVLGTFTPDILKGPLSNAIGRMNDAAEPCGDSPAGRLILDAANDLEEPMRQVREALEFADSFLPGDGTYPLRHTCHGCHYGALHGGPSHAGNPSCRNKQKTGSGSIAAGGTTAHCTCAGCF